MHWYIWKELVTARKNPCFFLLFSKTAAFFVFLNFHYSSVKLIFLLFIAIGAAFQPSSLLKVLSARTERVTPGIPDANITREYYIQVTGLKKGIRLDSLLINGQRQESKLVKHNKILPAKYILQDRDSVLIRSSFVESQRPRQDAKVILFFSYKHKSYKLNVDKISAGKPVNLP